MSVYYDEEELEAIIRASFAGRPYLKFSYVNKPAVLAKGRVY